MNEPTVEFRFLDFALAKDIDIAVLSVISRTVKVRSDS